MITTNNQAEEAVLALVEFPKQIVIALCVAVKHMKSRSTLHETSGTHVISVRLRECL